MHKFSVWAAACARQVCLRLVWPINHDVHISRSAQLAPYQGLFSFLYLKKIKILKIYVRFEKFQKYPSRPMGATGPLLFIFSAMDLVANLKKKITSRACRPP